MSFLIALYLLLVIVLPLVLSVVVSYRTLPRGTRCPLCNGDSLRIRSRWLRWLSSFKRGPALQRRWCLGCGWEGVCRVHTPEGGEVPASTPPGSAAPRADAPPADAPVAEAIDLRRLQVDGQPWQVLLQCWCDTEGWYGRLLFSAPSGRMWVDRTRTFTGPSPLDVLGQALSLSDDALATRLREVISSA